MYNKNTNLPKRQTNKKKRNIAKFFKKMKYLTSRILLIPINVNVLNSYIKRFSGYL